MGWGTRFRGNKFGRKKVEHAGRRFDSQLEKAVFDELTLLEKAGEIKDLRQQHTVYLTEARIGLRVDFSAVNTKTNELEFFEAKGYPTAEYQIKRRLWEYYGPGKLTVYAGTYKKPFVKEVVIPKGVT